MANILIVDDDANLGMALQMSLEQAGHQCTLAADGAAGWEALQGCSPELALLDLQLPDTTGIDLLARIQDHKPDIPVIIMTAFGTVTSAVSAMKQGAADFIEKPLSVKEMCRLVVRLLKSRELARRIDGRSPRTGLDADGRGLIVASPAMQRVVALAEKIAGLPARPGIGLTSILILGETGTGKEMVARYIHARGPDPGGQFIHVNCTAIPESLLETELFGHERGVFTDAKTSKPGLMEAAHGGTLFLDEIGDLPQPMQAKLLVAIESGRFRRVGATVEQTVDTRIITATNCDLEARSADGRFRPDLYHRLKMFEIHIPPLRVRPEDVSALADHFLDQFAQQLQRTRPELAPDARQALHAYAWPGNVRELAHMLLQKLVTCEKELLTADDLDFASGPQGRMPTTGAGSIQLDFSAGAVSLSEVEKRLLTAALAHANGNISEAAKLVGMPRGTFRYRMEKLGLISS